MESGCLTQLNLTNNIFKHSHRTNTPLYYISTDVRKAFDQVTFASFIKSLQLLGFNKDTVALIDNIQQGFQCYVSTPFGDTPYFDVEQGCKQGCALSPLKFNLVYDLFLKYLEANNRGYKWELKHTKDEQCSAR